MNTRNLAPLLLAAIVTLCSRASFGQSDEEHDAVDLTVDAQLGFESLEEPVPDELGIDSLTNQGYVTVNAAALLQLYNLQAFIQAPLRFVTSDFSIRKQDWDETNEYLRVFRCARVDYMSYGGSSVRLNENGACMSWTPDEAVGSVSVPRQDFTYLSLRLHPLTRYSLGYGSIVNGYNAMLEEDHFVEGVTAEVNLNRSLVFSAGLSDIISPTVTAGRLAWRPVQSSEQPEEYASGYYYSDSDTTSKRELFVEVGATTAVDFVAPATTLHPEQPPSTEERSLVVGGLDARVRYSTENTTSMESYRILRFELGSEYNQIFDFAGALHNHLRFYYDIGSVDFFVDAEYRAIFGQYIPSYFDQHYRVQRSQYLLSNQQRRETGSDSLSMTKLDFLTSLPDETEHAYGTTFRFRFWKGAEGGGGWNQAADLWLFLEQVPGRNLSGRAGVGGAIYSLDDKIDLWAQFVQQGWDDLEGLFSLANSVLEVNARYLLTDQIYLNFFYDQTWFLLNTESFDSTHNLGLSLGFLSRI
ncbi:MAG: hypothetical protein JW797_15945 [Bradymonadales bacterium]|nr:hypothetical protein [Bradymonadales bacterium]